MQNYWIGEIVKNLGENDDYCMVLLGNKCDVDPANRQVDKKSAKAFADSRNIYFQEVSAKNGLGINEVF